MSTEMIAWEYGMIALNDEPVESLVELNQKGVMGWEVVAIVPHALDGDDRGILLRRPIGKVTR